VKAEDEGHVGRVVLSPLAGLGTPTALAWLRLALGRGAILPAIALLGVVVLMLGAGAPISAIAAPRAAIAVAYLLLRLRLDARSADAGHPARLWAKDGALCVACPPDRAAPILRLPSGGSRSVHVVPDAKGAGAGVVFRGRLGVLVHAWFPRIEDARALVAELGASPLERPLTLSFFFGLRVTVGVDGVVVAWPLLRRRRFIPHDAIDDVRWSHRSVRLVLTDGRSYEIMTRSGKRGSGDAHRALVERLLEAREAYRKSTGGASVAALARGRRSLAAWIADLVAIGRPATSGYRAAALPPDVLWRVALDPAETEELRIGATLALRGGLDDEGRARLRVAAEASASPRVRVALAAAAADVDDASLAQRLAARPR
jgi:hypothetical protein